MINSAADGRPQHLSRWDFPWIRTKNRRLRCFNLLLRALVIYSSVLCVDLVCVVARTYTLLADASPGNHGGLNPQGFVKSVSDANLMFEVWPSAYCFCSTHIGFNV